MVDIDKGRRRGRCVSLAKREVSTKGGGVPISIFGTE